MPLPSPDQLLQQLETTTHCDRCRQIVLVAREHRSDPGLPALLDTIAAASDYHLVLTLLAAGQIGDLDRLRRALQHPSARVRRAAAKRLPLDDACESLTTAYLEASHSDRAALRARLRAEGRADVAAALMPHDLSDRERAALLPTADAATVARLLPDLADLVPSVRALTGRHPEAVLDHLARAVSGGAPQVVRDRAWAWVGPALTILARDHPERLLDLVEADPPPHAPWGLIASLATLIRRSPSRVATLLTDARTEWPSSLPGNVIRLFRRFTPDERVLLLQRARHNPEHVSTLLGALPPSERADAYARAGLSAPGTDTPHLLLVELPHDLRHAEARHQLARHAGDRQAQAAAVAFLPFDEARTTLDPLLSSADADERAAAYTALLASAGRERRGDVWARAVPLLERLTNERDPVRLAAAVGLAQAPISISATGPLGPVRAFVAAVVSARDSSPRTLDTLQDHCWAALRYGAENHRPELLTAHLELLDQLCAPDGTLSVPPLIAMPRGAEHQVVSALLPRIRAAAARGDRRLLHSLLWSLGTRAHAQAELQALLGDHVRTVIADSSSRQSVTLWLDDPAQRAHRVAEVLRADESTATMAPVQRAIMARRQDLAGVLWQERPLQGAFHDGQTRYVPLLDGHLHRLLPRQLDAYADALTATTADETRTWWAAQAIRQLGRLPGVGAARLEPFLRSTDVVWQEAALAALAWTDDTAAAIDRLLMHRGDDRARVAVAALERCALMTRPRDVVARLGVLLTPGSKVTSAKEGVRLLGSLRPPGALDLLLGAVGPERHRDVRIALARTVREFLDDERAWSVLDAAARATRDEARSLVETAPHQLAVRHRARYAAVLETASAQTPEIASNLGAWVAWRPQLAAALTSRVTDLANRAWPESVQGLLVALGDGVARREVLDLAATLADHALDAGQPDADADRDLPFLRRLDGLASALELSHDGLASVRGEVAQVLATRPSSRSAAVRLLIKAMEPTSLRDGLLTVCDIADDTADAHRVRSLLSGASQLGRCTDEQLSDAYAAVAARPSAVAGAAAVALVELRVGLGGWDETWRARIRELRRHNVTAVAEWAREVRTADE